MGKHFWPLFIMVAALGAATVWTQTPRIAPLLPPGLRATFRSYVRKAYDLPNAARTLPTPDPDPPVLLGGGTLPADTPIPQPAPAPSPAPAVAAAVAPADIKGVKVVKPASADWCVLTRSTPIEALDEKPLGTAAGGRMFIIERRARAAQGTLLIGNFTPKRLSQPVQINDRYALCLSGSPDDLTTAQLHALKMYYQLRGEALDYLDEVRRTNGDCASPLHRKLVEAERIRDFREKELRQMSGLRADQRAVEQRELDRLKSAAAALRAQHEEWKRAHSAQIADPTRDPHYQALVQEYRRYAASLPADLAVE